MAELLISGDEPGYDINAICKENTIDYDHIPNGVFIGKAIFGKEFDTSRFFLKHKKGYKKYILTKRLESDPDQSISNLNLLLAELKTDN